MIGCLDDYTVTLGNSLLTGAAAPAAAQAESFEIQNFQKLANGSYGDGLFHLCDYAVDLKPLLNLHVSVTDAQGNICYCGFVEEVYRCCGEYVAWGWSNATLYNAIRITYMRNGATRYTAWVEDAVSIADHGRRELVLPLPDSVLFTPEQYANRLLCELSQPRAVLHNTYKCVCPITYLVTRGYWETLAWQSYRNLCGLATPLNPPYTGGVGNSQATPLGLAVRSPYVGAYGGLQSYNPAPLPGANEINLLGMLTQHLTEFRVGSKVILSGFANAQNNGVATITSIVSDQLVVVTSTGISTTPGNDIHDANMGLAAGFVENQFLFVTGSGGALDGWHWVDETPGPDRIETLEGLTAASYLGAPVTLEGLYTVRVDRTLITEDPPNDPTSGIPATQFVTISSWDQWACQKVCNPCDDAWRVTHVSMALRKTGNPPYNVAITVATGCAGSLLASATITPAMVESQFTDVVVALNTPFVLDGGECVYVRVHPLVNPLDPGLLFHYYELGGQAVTYSSGHTGPDGITWQPSGYAYDVKLLEYVTLTELLFDLMNAWQFACLVAVLDEIEFQLPSYQESWVSLLYAVEQLLFLGTADCRRLQLQVRCVCANDPPAPASGGAGGGFSVVVGSEPLLADGAVILDCCGCTADGPCTLHAGNWLRPEEGPDGPIVDVPGVFLEALRVDYKSCRVKYTDRTFSRTLLYNALRFLDPF